jgi:hypothetical protein
VLLAKGQNCFTTKDTKESKALLIGQLQQFRTQLTEHFKRAVNYSIRQLIEFYSSCPSCSSW